MGQIDQAKQCPHCGSQMVLALPPGGRGPRMLRCFDCDSPDPIKSEAANWIKGELRPPK